MPAAAPRPDLPEVVESVGDIDGWLTPGQAAALYQAARRCPENGTIVEIGSFRGRSTVVLASAAPRGATVVAIDPHAGNDRGPQEIDGFVDEADEDHIEFLQNLDRAGVQDRVRHVRRFSSEAHGEVTGPIHVLYVDGAHRYAPARRDIVDWGERVEQGGSLLIHDSFSSLGVTSAILRELVPGGRFRYVDRSRSMAIYRADLDGSCAARLRNGGRQLAQLPWFAKNLALKLALVLGAGKLMERLDRTAPEWPY
jgi:predicted O-methyltransferase YrrM